ncbi:Hairy/enhancer-of-split with YRPW motif protein 2 [Coemansia javaensis]|uniref:Sugar phosphate phosphatase n=1 Tax=Coemansia javaensis TaxID=2761396 RepID=A0A9W8LFS4_9FUNG|nr:Hairy/enhancer-of-split with YRPW motif protein 2 [Coemansia javaensis]
MPVDAGLLFAPNDPPFKAHVAAPDGSNFTYASLHDRVPHILTDVINDLYAAVQERAGPEAAVAEGKALTGELSRLKHEMVTNKPLTPLEDDGEEDVAAWNHWLATYFPGATWYQTPFLAWETYMYRRMAGIFRRSQHWAAHDFFAARKEATFRASMAAVAQLCARVDALTAESAADPAKRRVAFAELLQASLWGNQTDLSMFPDLTSEALEEMQARMASGANGSKVVANDTDRIWQIAARLRGGRIDIVLDNSGFELLQDVLLAHWLVAVGIAAKVVFHPKRIPWYVSDVTNRDFHWLVDVARDPSLAGAPGLAPGDEATLRRLGACWAGLLADGVWELRDELFWTGPYGFRYLPTEGRDAWENALVKADIVFFKGDLNYRKLVYDLDWPVATPFAEALGPIAAPDAPAIVALRTAKCDTIVGIDEARARELSAEHKDWACSGQYGVIQLSPGRWAC